MSTKLFFSSIVGSAERAFAFISKALGVSCRLIIGKDLKGATLLWNDLVRRMYGYEPIEVLDMANSLVSHCAERYTFHFREPRSQFITIPYRQV